MRYFPELVIRRIAKNYKNNMKPYYDYLTKKSNEYNYSYYKFLIDNPLASKKDKRKAIKNFLDSTR